MMEMLYRPNCGVSLKIDRDLLHEKIAEARHKEIVGAIRACFGALLMIFGSILLMNIEEIRYEWYGFIPCDDYYRICSHDRRINRSWLL